MSPIVQLVLSATTSLIMLTVHSEWFALLVLMVLSSGFIRDWRRSYVVRITFTLPQRLWHYSIVDHIWISAHDQGGVAILYSTFLLLLRIIIDVCKVEWLVIWRIRGIIQGNLVFFQLGCRLELLGIFLIKLFIFIGIHILFTCIKSKV